MEAKFKVYKNPNIDTSKVASRYKRDNPLFQNSDPTLNNVVQMQQNEKPTEQEQEVSSTPYIIEKLLPDVVTNSDTYQAIHRGYNTVADVGLDLAKGILKFFEGIGDFLGTGVAAAGDELGADTTGLRELIEKDLSEKFMNSKLMTFSGDPIGTIAGKYKDKSINQAIREASYLNEASEGVQEGVHGVAQSIGEMLPSIAIGNYVGAAGASKAATEAIQLTSFGLGAAGNASEEALNEGATSGQALGYGALSGATEVATEKIFDVFGFFGGGVADKVIAKGGKPFKIVAGLLGEGVEEVLSDVAAPAWKQVVGMADTYKENAPSFADLAESFALGSITSMIMGGASTASSIARYSKDGAKFLSLNQDVSEINDAVKNEIDKVIKDRVTKEQWKELQNDSQAYNNLVAEVIDELNALNQGHGDLPKVYKNIQSLIDAKNKIIVKMNNLLNNMSEEKIKKVSQIKLGTTTNEKGEKVDYTLGQDFLANTIDISDINNHNVTLDKGVRVVGKGTISNNQVTIDEASAQNLTNSQKVQANRIVRAINTINSKFGTKYDVVFTDGLIGKDSEGKDVNLHGNKINGTFYININSQKALLKTTMHELTHTLENTTMYDELLKFTKDTLGEERFRKIMEVKRPGYERLGQGDDTILEREVVADAFGSIFDTYEDVKKLVNANESLAKKIKNWIARKFNQSKGDTALRKELKPAYEMLNKALGEKNPQKSEQNVSNLSGLTIVGNSAIRFDAVDLRRANDDKETFINNAVDTLYNIEKKGKYRETKTAIRERIEKYFNDMIDVAAIMDDYGISYSPSEIGTAIKPNGDYIYSLDLSTICAKRLQMQEVWDEIVRKDPKAFNDPRSFFKLIEDMHKNGLTTPCGICFVESRRKILGEMTTKFLNCKNAKIENKSSNKYKAQQEILKYEEQTQSTLTADKLLDSTSLEEIREKFPSLYSIYNTFYGAIKPKLSEKPTSFKFGVIKSLFTDKNGNINHKLVEEVNNHGGFRMLSFSDFQVEHAIDFMQAILECDSLGLKVQAYTKVPEFAKLVKGTNIKLNLSLVVMQDKNGNFNFSSKEGMDVEIAKMLRELDANIGTIVVGPDILTSLKLIGLDYIDYIIPFHRSAISMTGKKGQVSESHRLGLTGYIDFTNFQNEKKGVLGKNKTQENVPQDAYWSYNVSGNENSKRYIEYCVKNDIKPKFYDVFLAPTLRDAKTGKPSKKGVSFEYFLNQNGIKYEKFSYKKYEFIIPDGYWKSLGDYRNYDNNGKAVPQVPVKANFDKATWEDLLKNYKSPRLKMANGTYVSEGELTTIENKVVDQFLEDVKNNNLNSDLYGKPLSDSSNTNKIKYSIETDSNGNKLSEQQVEFFKDSKVRDESGKLLVVYHGTQSDFNVYDRSKLGKTTQSDDAKLGFHFTDNHDLANIFSKLYSDDLIYKVMDEVTNELGYDDVNEIEKRLQAFASKNGKIKEQYLNIKNPLDFSVGKNSTSFSDLGYAINYALEGKKELVSNDEEIKSFEDIGNIVKSNFDGEIQTIKSQLATTKGAIDRLKELGYDGLILPMASTDAATLANEYDKNKNINLKGKEYVTFESNQVKNIDNYNPSSSNDIRYSVETDSEGSKLSKQQAEFFKDSKVRDKNGKLLKMYHGTHSDFTVFSKTSRTLISPIWIKNQFWFTTSKDYALEENTRRTKLKEVYLNIKNPFKFNWYNMDTAFDDNEIRRVLHLRKNAHLTILQVKSYVSDLIGLPYSLAASNNQSVEWVMEHKQEALDHAKKFSKFYERLVPSDINIYDGIEFIPNGTGEVWYIAFDSNQIKNTTNLNPTSNEDIRFSVNELIPTNALEETASEVSNITRERGIESTKPIDANYVRGKANYDNDAVYQKKTASKILDKSLINVFKAQNGGKTISIKGQKDKVIDYIFQEMNKTKLEDILSGQATDSMANKLAEYIINNISTKDSLVPSAEKTTLVSELAANIQEAYLNEGKIAGYKAMKEKLSGKIAELRQRLRWNKRLVIETRKMSRAIATFKKTTNRSYSNNSSAKPLDKIFTQAVDVLKKLRLTNFYTQEARSIMKEYRDVFYNEDNEMLKDDYSQMIVDMIDSITSGSGNLDVYEMNTLVNIYQSLNKLIKYYDNVVFEDRVEKATKVATNLQNDIASGRKINRNIGSNLINTIQKPRLVFRQFDGSSGEADNSLTNLVYGELRKAEDTYKKNDTMFREKILDFEKDHKKFNKRLFKETVEINGKKISLGEAITIYQWSRREQARKHFMKDVNPSAQGINIYSQKNGNFLGTFTLTQEDIDKLHDSFDNETLEYINFIDGLIEDAKVLKEETDYKALGFTNAIEDFYFPIMTDSMYNSYKNFGDVRNVKAIDSVLGLSMNKNVVVNANNKLRLQNVYDIVNRHINQASKYNAYYVTIKAIQKSMNTYTENKTTAKQSLMEANPDIVDYIDNLIIDVADVRQHESKFGELISNFLRGNLATANLGLNLKVIFNQLSSIPTALSLLSPTSISKSYKMGIGKASATEMDKYCRYTYYRNFYNTRVLNEIYRSDSNTIIDEGFSTIREGYHKVQNLVMQPISWMDRRAMVRLWNACQVEVESKYGLEIGTEENKIKAGELLEKVVRETQPDYSPLESPAIKKSRSELVRWMTMFTTQPLQNLNQIIEASNDIRNIREQIKKNGSNEELNAKLKKANRKLIRNVSSVMAANLMYTLIALGFKELLGKRKDDEGIAKEFINDFMGTNVGMIPIIREIYNKVFNNYDISADPLGAVNDIFDATKSIYNNVSNGNYQGLWYKLSKALSTLTGIPFKNINEYSMALIGAFSPSTAYKYRSIWYNKTVSAYVDDLEKAITKKDDSQINAIIQALYSKKGINLTDSNLKELNKLSRASTKPLITLKSITSSTVINGEQVEINDTSKVKKYYSENVNASLNSLIKNAYYAGLSKEEKAYAIKLSNDAAFYKALTKVLKTDIKENKINLLTKAFSGNTYYTMIAALAKCKNSLKGDKVKIQKYINSLRLSKEQKYILYGLAGYKPLNDNAATQVSNYLTVKGYDKEMREYIMDFAKLI